MLLEKNLKICLFKKSHQTLNVFINLFIVIWSHLFQFYFADNDIWSSGISTKNA